MGVLVQFATRSLANIVAVAGASTMRLRRFRRALPLIITIAAGSSFLLWAAAIHRREHYRDLAAYYLQRAAESVHAGREEAYVADLAEGKATSPILAFLHPIGDPVPHRAAATAHQERANQFFRMSSVYEAAADRLWGSVNLSAGPTSAGNGETSRPSYRILGRSFSDAKAPQELHAR